MICLYPLLSSYNVLYLSHIQDPNMVESLQSAMCQMGDHLEGTQLIQETAKLADREHMGIKGTVGWEAAARQTTHLPNQLVVICG